MLRSGESAGCSGRCKDPFVTRILRSACHAWGLLRVVRSNVCIMNCNIVRFGIMIGIDGIVGTLGRGGIMLFDQA